MFHKSFGDEHNDAITALQWNSGGTQLLSADASGTVVMWRMKRHLMNDWECAIESHLPGEPIIALDWLRSGIKVSLCLQFDNLPTEVTNYRSKKCIPTY